MTTVPKTRKHKQPQPKHPQPLDLCPCCSGEGAGLGVVMGWAHYRCIACGMMFVSHIEGQED